MTIQKYRYIVIEGPIGVGKTSLAKLLAQHLRCELMLESPDENPFLPKFYEDSQRYALPTQLFFLFQRINQLQKLGQMDLFSAQHVADFLLDKDWLFAELTLNDEEYRLYQMIYQQLKVQIPKPDLIIYLQAPTHYLLERVNRRGNSYELNMSETYLKKLSESYSRFFHQYEEAPLLIVNSENLNFVDQAKDFELLLQCINQFRGPREFFNRAQ